MNKKLTVAQENALYDAYQAHIAQKEWEPLAYGKNITRPTLEVLRNAELIEGQNWKPTLTSAGIAKSKELNFDQRIADEKAAREALRNSVETQQTGLRNTLRVDYLDSMPHVTISKRLIGSAWQVDFPSGVRVFGKWEMGDAKDTLTYQMKITAECLKDRNDLAILRLDIDRATQLMEALNEGKLPQPEQS